MDHRHVNTMRGRPVGSLHEFRPFVWWALIIAAVLAVAANWAYVDWIRRPLANDIGLLRAEIEKRDQHNERGRIGYLEAVHETTKETLADLQARVADLDRRLKAKEF